jgi:hypothetical protein
MNSDAHTNARLRDTITNYGFRIDTNAYVLSNEKFGECYSQAYRARYLGLSLSFCFSPDQNVSKHSLFQMFKDGRYSPPQSAVFTGYSSKSAAEHTSDRGFQMQTRLHTVPYLEKYMDALL